MFVDTFPYGQVGMILERFILTKENQIIIQCGYNFTGEISNAAFNYTGECWLWYFLRASYTTSVVAKRYSLVWLIEFKKNNWTSVS